MYKDIQFGLFDHFIPSAIDVAFIRLVELTGSEACSFGSQIGYQMSNFLGFSDTAYRRRGDELCEDNTSIQ